jgi:hypothetical protein
VAKGAIAGQGRGSGQARRCDLAWTVKDVPEGASGYQVRIAHRVGNRPGSYDIREGQFGFNPRPARLASEMTQDRLARALHVGPHTVSSTIAEPP